MAAPNWQLPWALQVAAGMKLPPAQEPGVHTVPGAYRAQPPWPLHFPEKPQVETSDLAHSPCGSSAPALAGTHWPGCVGSLQVTQGPSQTVLQQTPSTHVPESHSLLFAHVRPTGFLPHEPSLQARPLVHSASVLHSARHVDVVLSQMNGAQL
ncbi:MAG: hypothetical protein SF187_26930 [Deltaproteobacteria bacterium]|nr:hypothetical protein [Deltaproteobacteria bacterium]